VTDGEAQVWTDLEVAYRERAAKLDGINKAAPWMRLYRELTLSTIDALAAPGDRVLDAACGTGIFATHLLERGYSVVMLDALPNMLSLARRKAEQLPIESSRFTTLRSQLTDLQGCDDASFDLVICTQALNMCGDLVRVFSEFRRVLRPGGTLFCDIDGAYRWAVVQALSGDAENARNILVDGYDAAGSILGPDYYFIGPERLRGHLERAGFAVQNMRGLLYFAPLLHVWGDSATYVERPGLPFGTEDPSGSVAFEALRSLELESLELGLPLEMAGWVQVTAS